MRAVTPIIEAATQCAPTHALMSRPPAQTARMSPLLCDLRVSGCLQLQQNMLALFPKLLIIAKVATGKLHYGAHLEIEPLLYNINNTNKKFT